MHSPRIPSGFQKLFQKIKNKEENFIITDIRHQNELDALSSNFETSTLNTSIVGDFLNSS